MKPVGAWVSILALFVSGVAIGALVMQLVGGEQEPARYGSHGPGERRGGASPHSERVDQFLAERLDLDASQAEAVEEVLMDSRRRAREMRETWRPQIEAHLAETRRRVEAVLNDDQRAELTKFAADDARRLERMLLGGGPSRRRGPRSPRRGAGGGPERGPGPPDPSGGPPPGS